MILLDDFAGRRLAREECRQVAPIHFRPTVLWSATIAADPTAGKSVGRRRTGLPDGQID